MPPVYHPRMTFAPSRVTDLLAEARLAIDPVDADLLLAHTLGKSRTWLFAHADDAVEIGRAHV